MAAVKRNQPRRAKSSDSTYSLMEFMRDFPDDATCLEWLWRRNYSVDGEHAECPKCGRERKFHRVASRPSWSCDNCGHHLHPTAGTIFHKSSTSLHLWFYAVFMMGSTRCGVSAKHLERELGVTYKTAWRMANLIRTKLMAQDDDDQLSGEVEMDEMYVGGKPRGRDRAEWKGKKPWERQKAVAAFSERKAKVFGMVERGGRVSAHVVPDTTGDTLGRHVQARVLPSTVVYTDEAPVYTGITRKGGYEHKRIHHQAKVYVKGNVHTQTIEGFWGLVKTGLSGNYHAVSHKWLQGYLNEFAWRYNHRDDARPMVLTLLGNAAAIQ